MNNYAVEKLALKPFVSLQLQLSAKHLQDI